MFLLSLNLVLVLLLLRLWDLLSDLWDLGNLFVFREVESEVREAETVSLSLLLASLGKGSSSSERLLRVTGLDGRGWSEELLTELSTLGSLPSFDGGRWFELSTKVLGSLDVLDWLETRLTELLILSLELEFCGIFSGSRV